MGAIVSSLGITMKTLRDLNSSYATLLQRVNGSPGKPVANSTLSTWQLPPSPLASHSSETTPEEVDVLIIGSGITACSIAHGLLRASASNKGRIPSVAIFEARELCSGATGRNGGHIKESPYIEWGSLVKRFGRTAADEVVRFRMAHLKQLLELAENEGMTITTESREVETVDVYCEAEAWRDAQQKLRAWLEAFPAQKDQWNMWEGDDLKTKFALTTAKGVITGPAGAVAPYSLVTELYAKLLRQFPTLFSIDCNTPIETLQGTPVDPWRRPLVPLKPYSCFTFQGKSQTIKATHVVHATNGHVSRLVPGLKGKIIPARGQMTCQRLLPDSIALPGGSSRSWSFIWSKGFDYMTVRDDGRYMLGGGWSRGSDAMDALGNATDDENSLFAAAYLRGLLPTIFPDLVKAVATEQVWTGTLGFSVDSLPWVGPVPEGVAGGRKRGTGSEWVCAGYSGEGMVNAWGCGQGVAAMIRNQMYGETEVVGVPSVMFITENRVKKAKIEMMVEDYMNR